MVKSNEEWIAETIQWPNITKIKLSILGQIALSKEKGIDLTEGEA